MNIHTYKHLAGITKQQTGLTLRVTNEKLTSKTQTCYQHFPFLAELDTITIHEDQLEIILPGLLKRGFNPEFALLQVLLHEICHYKQHRKRYKDCGILKKFLRKFDATGYHKKNTDHLERMADKFAKIYYRRFIS